MLVHKDDVDEINRILLRSTEELFWLELLGTRLYTPLFVAPVLLSTMPGFIRAGEFVAEMFLCEETYKAFIMGHPVGWYKPEDKKEYRCYVPDPRTFPRRHGADKSDLPFKYICDTEDDHHIAGEGYARALRKGVITGNPSYLLRVSAPIKNFLDRLEDGGIVVYAGQYTVGFVKPLTPENYPGFILRGTEVTNEEGADILEQVYKKKPLLRKRKVPEESAEGGEVCPREPQQ